MIGPFGFGLPRYKPPLPSVSAWHPTARVRLGHRPGGGASSAFLRILVFVLFLALYAVAASLAAAGFCGQRNASPLTSILCRITASLRASATHAFL